MDMATHSSILAWKIPWAEEPGGLQSMGTEVLKPGLSGTLILSRPSPIPKTEGKKYNKEEAFYQFMYSNCYL